jgi:hypothetical protein
MNGLTEAIGVFEAKIEDIRTAFKEKYAGYRFPLPYVYLVKRDEDIEKCLWAINVLHDAHVAKEKYLLESV